MEFCVLASGSSGNVSVVRHGGVTLLIDVGLSPRRLERQLEAVGLGWADIHAALLTHTHGDHCHPSTAQHLCGLRIPLYCHPRHVQALAVAESPFLALKNAGLLRTFEVDRPFLLAALDEAPGAAGAAETQSSSFQCVAFALPHDSGVNCGFRIGVKDPADGRTTVLGYACDLGSWNEGVVARLKNVDILALEFNHDETLQRESGRPSFLIQRVLGARGHLSNRQAADLLQAILQRSQPGRVAHVVMLHLSGQCNDRELAEEAARQVILQSRSRAHVHTACAQQPTSWISPATMILSARREFRQAFLPGWEAC